jgi:hypothetical protein
MRFAVGVGEDEAAVGVAQALDDPDPFETR